MFECGCGNTKNVVKCASTWTWQFSSLFRCVSIVWMTNNRVGYKKKNFFFFLNKAEPKTFLLTNTLRMKIKQYLHTLNMFVRVCLCTRVCARAYAGGVGDGINGSVEPRGKGSRNYHISLPMPRIDIFETSI